ncbi:hypothetical protein [Saccharibacillus deserti]|uniref:hypothetical protein n=1 Tax=Saccharibacillus deserti TaxID=1634444 RepID=UPI001557673E|nr:hypothetical protein [Saccharibacillus deserti]
MKKVIFAGLALLLMSPAVASAADVQVSETELRRLQETYGLDPRPADPVPSFAGDLTFNLGGVSGSFGVSTLSLSDPFAGVQLLIGLAEPPDLRLVSACRLSVRLLADRFDS